MEKAQLTESSATSGWVILGGLRKVAEHEPEDKQCCSMASVSILAPQVFALRSGLGFPQWIVS